MEPGPRTAQLARQTVSLHLPRGLCAVLDPQRRCHQGHRASAAHNPALFIRRLWAIHLSGPDENRPLDAVVMAARRTKILGLVRLTEYPFPLFFLPLLRGPLAEGPATAPRPRAPGRGASLARSPAGRWPPPPHPPPPP